MQLGLGGDGGAELASGLAGRREGGSEEVFVVWRKRVFKDSDKD